MRYVPMIIMILSIQYALYENLFNTNDEPVSIALIISACTIEALLLVLAVGVANLNTSNHLTKEK